MVLKSESMPSFYNKAALFINEETSYLVEVVKILDSKTSKSTQETSHLIIYTLNIETGGLEATFVDWFPKFSISIQAGPILLSHIHNMRPSEIKKSTDFQTISAAWGMAKLDLLHMALLFQPVPPNVLLN